VDENFTCVNENQRASDRADPVNVEPTARKVANESRNKHTTSNDEVNAVNSDSFVVNKRPTSQPMDYNHVVDMYSAAAGSKGSISNNDLRNKDSMNSVRGGNFIGRGGLRGSDDIILCRNSAAGLPPPSGVLRQYPPCTSDKLDVSGHAGKATSHSRVGDTDKGQGRTAQEVQGGRLLFFG